MRTLELRGLVDVRQGSTGGYFVREVDDRPLVRDFETLFRLGRVSWSQLVEARRLIEPEVAALAAQRATEVDLKNLGAALEQRWEHAVPGLSVVRRTWSSIGPWVRRLATRSTPSSCTRSSSSRPRCWCRARS